MIGTWKATIIDPSAFFQNFQTRYKRLYIIKSLFFFSIFSQSTNSALEKALKLNNALLQWLKNGRKALITKEILEKDRVTDLSKGFDCIHMNC